MSKLVEKRTVDMQIIGDWVEPNTRVLDLGCGPGALLDYLVQSKKVSAVGVDLDLTKITACVRRGRRNIGADEANGQPQRQPPQRADKRKALEVH